MSKKKLEEWFIVAPWGKIAMAAWGNPDNPPLLMVHGYMDTTATFILLLDQLPDNYYYVGFDIPGHGKSDPFPPGLIINQLHVVEVIRRVVEAMKWKKFIYMAHSMGCVIGSFYHYLYPDFIKKMIFLDPAMPLAVYYYVHSRPAFWYHIIYSDYSDNYQKWKSGKPRLHTYDSAISLVVRNRNLTEDQAEIVLSRSLVPMGIDSYKLSWEPRMKKLAQLAISEEILYTMMTTKSPPTLIFDVTDSQKASAGMKFAENLLNKCEQTLSKFYRVTVMGGHDVHITNPELLAPHIEKFLNYDKKRSKSYFKKSKL